MRSRYAGRWSIGLLFGCSAPAAPLGGAISITASITGGGSDPNGFEVVIDRRIALPLTGISPTVYGPIEAGEHDLELTGLSPSCRAAEGAALRTTVSEGDTARVEFVVLCDPGAGLIEVEVSTSGADFDPNGYSITVDQVRLGDVPRVGRFSGSAQAGRRVVGLDGLTPNCSAGDQNPQVASVPIGGIVGFGFQVECSPAPPAGRGHELAVVRNRFEGEAALLLVNDDGTGSRTLVLVPDSVVDHPSWSPDGSRIVGLLHHQLNGSGHLVIIDAATGDVTRVPGSDGAGPPTWSPDGGSILFSQVVEEFDAFQVFRMKTDGSDRERLTATEPAGAFQPTVSPDGTRIAYIHEDFGAPGELRMLSLTDRTTSVLVTPESEFASISDPAWSPDGKSIAFRQGVDFRQQIFVVAIGDPHPRQLTSALQPSYQPTWSPDSRTIAFQRGDDENAELYIMDADGTNQTPISDNEQADEDPAWRP